VKTLTPKCTLMSCTCLNLMSRVGSVLNPKFSAYRVVTIGDTGEPMAAPFFCLQNVVSYQNCVVFRQIYNIVVI